MTRTITQGDRRSLRRIIRKHIVRSDRDFGMLRTEYIERVEVDDMAADLVEWADRRALRTAPAPAPTVVPEAAVEAATAAVRRERAFAAAAAFGVPLDDVPECAEMIARAALTAALPLLTAAPSATREEVADVAAQMHPSLHEPLRTRVSEAWADALLARFTMTPKEDR
mgnify:CR=1 FL=1